MGIETFEKNMYLKKILMINPPTGLFIRDDRCQSNVEGFLVSVSRPPHELMLMAAGLKDKGHQVSIFDYPIEGKSLFDYKSDFQENLPDVLVINATIPTINEDIKCAKIAKQIKNDLLVVLRCGAIEDSAENLMKQEEGIDVILYGETDFTLAELLENNDKNKVRGIFYRNDIHIVKTLSRTFLDNLDSLPMVDRSLVKNELYIRPDNGKPLGLIEVSRGCPYSCIYCLVSISYGKIHRTRSVCSVIKEIKNCVEEHGIFDFHFKSDLFIFNREWVIELGQEIIKNKLEIRWFANSRVDKIDDGILKILKSSGCFALAIGVESGSQYILDKIKKSITIDRIKKTFLMCKKNKIKTYAYFIIGFPWDTKYTVKDTVAFSKKIDPDYIDFFFPFAFKGTELFRIVKDLGLIDEGISEDSRRNSYTGAQFASLHFSKKELNRLRKAALRSFYFRPEYVLKTFRRCENMSEVFHVFRYAISMLKKIIK
ncbi:MAG: radical SAM protein [Candidatus Omnitrophica bacterium]|nr:radical SAM protein [Candidatus Omnitrophota bacterium]